MSFQIEDAVPMPGRRNRYPFDQMAPGQSFEIVSANEARKVRNAAYQFAKKVNGELKLAKGDADYVAFALRKTGEIPSDTGGEPTKVYRLWRE